MPPSSHAQAPKSRSSAVTIARPARRRDPSRGCSSASDQPASAWLATGAGAARRAPPSPARRASGSRSPGRRARRGRRGRRGARTGRRTDDVIERLGRRRRGPSRRIAAASASNARARLTAASARRGRRARSVAEAEERERAGGQTGDGPTRATHGAGPSPRRPRPACRPPRRWARPAVVEVEMAVDVDQPGGPSASRAPASAPAASVQQPPRRNGRSPAAQRLGDPAPDDVASSTGRRRCRRARSPGRARDPGSGRPGRRRRTNRGGRGRPPRIAAGAARCRGPRPGRARPNRSACRSS